MPKSAKPAAPGQAAFPKGGAALEQRFTQAVTLHQSGRLAEAQSLYAQVLKLRPTHFGALHLSGVIAAQSGNFERAEQLIAKAIAINPSIATAHSNRGNALKGLNRLQAAVQSYDRAIALKPDYAEAHNNRGVALQALKQFEAAVQSYDRAIALKPDYAEACNNRGVALHELKQFEAAVASYDRAIAIRPDYAEAYSYRGATLQELKQFEAAVQSCERAIALRSDYAEAHGNCAAALQALRQLKSAMQCYDRAIALKPDYAEAYNNRGVALQELGQLENAVASYDKAIAIRPDYAEAYYNRGNALKELKQLEAALQSYEQAMSLKPDYEFLHGMLLHTRLQACDWSNAEKDIAELTEKIQRNENATQSFIVLAIADAPALQKQAAGIWVRAKAPSNHSLPDLPTYPRHDRIRVGYYSADYHNHATAQLMAGLFEAHDRSRFELTAFSFGPEKNDAMRQRVSSAFDRFIDIRDKTDRDAAHISRQLEIDIAVDLKGFTTDGRMGIFAERAAPIQLSYLGYPGTTDAEYMDYVIADRILIPESSQAYFSEKIVYLPDSYQVNDDKRAISDRQFRREELGLPASGFVFCCFNNNYKINPATFDGWMRILKQVDGSVIWLLEDNPVAAANLRSEAEKRGVDAKRLVFARRMPLEEHLARHRLADLFVDTLPYNAHTTASDALWAGLPVLTCLGNAFAGRVAASLLYAIRLPELVTHTREEYESLAMALATHPERLAAIKQKLENNRLTAPLFDTLRFTGNIESAYEAVYRRYQAGLPADHIYIQP